MEAYIINLEERRDRWSSAIYQFANLPFTPNRVDAISIGIQNIDEFGYLTPGVLAIWSSHLKAMTEFLKTENEYCIIFEDDFLIEQKDIQKVIEVIKDCDFDFLQLGYLRTRKKDYLDVFYSNTADLIFKLLNFLSKKNRVLEKHFGNKYLVRRHENTKFTFVMDDIRAGAHAYVASRKFASEMLVINNPPFLSTDQLFISLGTMRIFRMARIRKSLIAQSKSPSSITQRFKSK
jgi:hypothetical protein